MPASSSTSASPTTTSFPNGINSGGVVLSSAGNLTVPGTSGVTGVETVGGFVNTGAVNAVGSVATGLTAHAAGGQASALALTASINRVDTVGTAADSVKLPAPSYVGQQVVVINNAASNSMQVFGAGTDTINAVATGTGVAHAAGKTAVYYATSIGTAASWFRNLSA
jgi:hypothetical protein